MSAQTVLFDHPGPKARARHRLIALVSVVLVLAFLAWMVSRLAAKGNFDAAKWNPFATPEVWVNYLIPGLINTVKAAALAMILAGIYGLVFGMGRLSHLAPVRWLSTLVVELFRAVPVLVMMSFTFYLCLFQLNTVIPGSQAPFVAVVAGLTLYNGSVVAELLRSGVGGLPKGQTEAGYAIGLTRGQTLRTILLPQAITAMLPALVGQLVVVLKDTAIGFVAATYFELLRSGDQIGSAYGNPVPAMMVVAVLYILVNYSVTSLAGYLENRSRAKGRAVIPRNAAGPGHIAPVDTEALQEHQIEVDDEVLRERYHKP